MEYNWEILGLKTVIETGIVEEILYLCTVENEGVRARIQGSVELEGESDNVDTIPYEDLTEYDIMLWLMADIKNKKKVEKELKKSVDGKIKKKKEKTHKIGSPWKEKKEKKDIKPDNKVKGKK